MHKSWCIKIIHSTLALQQMHVAHCRPKKKRKKNPCKRCFVFIYLDSINRGSKFLCYEPLVSPKSHTKKPE